MVCGIRSTAVTILGELNNGRIKIEQHGPTHLFWLVRSFGDAGVLRVGRSKPLVCFGLFGSLLTRVCVWFSSGGLAVWRRGSDMVNSGIASMVAKKIKDN